MPELTRDDCTHPDTPAESKEEGAMREKIAEIIRSVTAPVYCGSGHEAADAILALPEIATAQRIAALSARFANRPPSFPTESFGGTADSYYDTPLGAMDLSYQGALEDTRSAVDVLIRRINGEASLESAADWVRWNYPEQAKALRASALPDTGVGRALKDEIVNAIRDYGISLSPIPGDLPPPHIDAKIRKLAILCRKVEALPSSLDQGEKDA